MMRATHRTRVLGLALLAVLVTALGACAPKTTEPASNAVLLPISTDPTVSLTVWFQVGSQDDPIGKEGLAALTGTLIAQGSTTQNSFETILEKLFPLAAGYDTRIDKEMTTLTGRTHLDNLDAYFQLFTEAYLQPAFSEDDFERLRSDQLNYLETTLRFALDEDLGKAALEHAVFGGTRYAHPIQGTVEGLKAITLEDVRAFYQQHYTAANAVVALGGSFDDSLVSRFEATLEKLPQSEPAANSTTTVVPAVAEGRQVLLVQKPNADASISFGFAIDVQRGDDDFYALWLANSWLGEHRNTSSHLFQVIREQRGLNYGDYSYIEKFPEGGRRQMPPVNVARNHQIFEGWIRTLPNEQAVFALRAALREIEDLITHGMTEEEFELTRSFLEKYHLHFAATTQQRLGYRLDDAFYGIDGEGHLAQFGERMKSLTLEQVNAALKKHLQLDNLHIAIVTGDAEGLSQALASGEPTPISYSTPKPEEVLAEDPEIASYPLNISADAIKTIPVSEFFER